MAKELMEKNYMKTYVAAEDVWNSEKSTCEELAVAWRTQRALLIACCSNDPVKQITVLKRHYNKLEQKNREVQKLCDGSSSAGSVNIMVATKRKFSDTDNVTRMKENVISSNFEKRTQIVADDVASVSKKHHEDNAFSTICTRSKQFVANNVPRMTATQNEEDAPANNEFLTARQLLIANSLKKNSHGSSASTAQSNTKPIQAVTATERPSVVGGTRLGLLRNSPTTRRTVHSGFVSPVQKENNDINSKLTPSPPEVDDLEVPDIDPSMVKHITNRIMRKDTKIGWSDIAGLENAKTFIREAAVLPILRPDIFSGVRKPPRGILLFGPPGTGKTLIGKCIASESGSTFFSISASTLTSKYVGEGEKMVCALFAVAAMHKPAVIFIDEIDSLLSKRSESEHESSRRLKNEFLLQFDGTNTSEEDRTLVIGATNRPHELDEAARRRFVRRLYIPLPESAARLQIVNKQFASVSHDMTVEQMEEVVRLTAGYSGADIDSLCHEAAMLPLRSIPLTQMLSLPADEVRPVNIDDFRLALRSVRPSVAQNDLNQYLEWNRQYGSL